MQSNIIYLGDNMVSLKTLSDNSVDCVITSPPYYKLRNYGVAGQIGLEETPEMYVDRLVSVFREVRRVLKPEGTLWLVIGDSYAGSGCGPSKSSKQRSNKGSFDSPIPIPPDGCKRKDLIGIPWMVAFALRSDGWYLRQDIIFSKTNPMPESVTDRCTKSHEYIFLMSKSAKYYFNHNAIKEPVAKSTRRVEYIENAPRYGGKKYTEYPDQFYRTKSGNAYKYREMRHKRDVWHMPTQPVKDAHFATFPEELVRNCLLAGCPEGGIVLDPFIGSGTTAVVAIKYNRHYIGCELNPNYIKIAEKRISQEIAK